MIIILLVALNFVVSLLMNISIPQLTVTDTRIQNG